MIEIKCGLKTIDLPFMIQVYEVTEEMFDEWVDEDAKAEWKKSSPKAKCFRRFCQASG
jgi:hypothetical protein